MIYDRVIFWYTNTNTQWIKTFSTHYKIFFTFFTLSLKVPPDILDYPTSTDMVVKEGSNVTLKCAATGSPTPVITWRREGGEPISLSVGVEGNPWFYYLSSIFIERFSVVERNVVDEQWSHSRWWEMDDPTITFEIIITLQWWIYCYSGSSILVHNNSYISSSLIQY